MTYRLLGDMAGCNALAALAPGSRLWPHRRQKLALGRFKAPHLGQNLPSCTR